MSLVNADTGEVVADISADDARDLTDKIKVAVEGVWHLVKQAYELRAWAALGYSSWDDYCTREFGSARIRLPREERQEVVASLRESGLSIRAIAAATGTGTRQVQEALAQVCSENTPEEEKVQGTDGKTYPSARDRPAAPATAQKPRRSPLADDAMNAGWQLRKAVERLVRLAEDDRFSANKEQVASHLTGHLLYTQEVCQDLLNTLKENNK